MRPKRKPSETKRDQSESQTKPNGTKAKAKRNQTRPKRKPSETKRDQSESQAKPNETNAKAKRNQTSPKRKPSETKRDRFDEKTISFNVPESSFGGRADQWKSMEKHP